MKTSDVLLAILIILVVVDYNPNSSLLAMEKIQQLPFASQVKMFHTGVGMWRHHVVQI